MTAGSLEPHLHAAAWHKLATDRTLYEELSGLARHHVQTHFNMEGIRARFLNVLRQICGTRV
jgi:hypothetical protein